jgi:hypothetical protein
MLGAIGEQRQRAIVVHAPEERVPLLARLPNGRRSQQPLLLD